MRLSKAVVKHRVLILIVALLLLVPSVLGMANTRINYDMLETYKDFGGIRLEDDILITPEGSRFTGDKRIPITIEEVEKIMNEQ